MKPITFFKNYLLEFLSVLMLAAALFFFINVQGIKSSLKKTNPEAFRNNELVKITKIIDGDEVFVESQKGTKAIIRLLGIKSFDPTTSDPAILEYGKICFNFLEQKVLNKQAQVKLPAEIIIDKKGRLIAYLFLKDKDKDNDSDNDYSVDLGKLLLQKGISMVYTRYDFAKMKEYLEVEAAANANHIGFWANKSIKSRVESLKKLWMEERLSND